MVAPRRKGPVKQDLNPSFNQAAYADIKMSFDGAGQGRRLSGWSPSLKGPNAQLKGMQPLRNRARDVTRNDWAGRRAGRVWGTQIIGIGIKSRFDRIKNTGRRQEVADLFDTFMRECDADGVSHWFAMQMMAEVNRFTAGEVFVRVRPRELSLPLSVPVQLQMHESEMCPDFDAERWPGLPEGHRIVSGIELNKYDRRIAYWFYKNHPGEFSSITKPVGTDMVRVAASEVWHLYRPDRPGALRGVSSLSAVLTRLRSTGDFEDAVLDRQKLANLFTLFITKTLPEQFWQGEPVDPLTGMPRVWNGAAPVAGLEPGMGVELRPGEDVKFANPPEAGTEYASYVRASWLGVAAGTDIPYELLTGDLREISDRALRVILNEFHRLLEAEQWQVVIPKMCQPFVELFAKFALIAGHITFEEAELIKRATHAPQAWAYVHPVQDVQGEALQVKSGLKARSTWQNERGYDPEREDELRAQDRKREDALGLNAPTAAEQAALDAKAAGSKQAKKTDAEARLFERNILSQIAANATRPSEQPTINVAAPVLTVQPPNVTVTNTMPAPITNVTNDVPAPIVNVTNDVPAPNVEITNEIPVPSVVVESAQVTVNNEVKPADVKVELPTRVTTSQIVRDSDGNITRVTQTEKTSE